MRVVPTNGDDDIFIVTRSGMTIRFSENDVRPMGRDAAGVRGIRLRGAQVGGCGRNRRTVLAPEVELVAKLQRQIAIGVVATRQILGELRGEALIEAFFDLSVRAIAFERG